MAGAVETYVRWVVVDSNGQEQWFDEPEHAVDASDDDTGELVVYEATIEAREIKRELYDDGIDREE